MANQKNLLKIVLLGFVFVSFFTLIYKEVKSFSGKRVDSVGEAEKRLN